MLTCREFAELLMEYLDCALPERRLSDFERHLDTCTACQAYLQTYQATIHPGKAAFADPDAEVPADVPDDLVRAVLAARRGEATGR